MDLVNFCYQKKDPPSEKPQEAVKETKEEGGLAKLFGALGEGAKMQVPI